MITLSNYKDLGEADAATQDLVTQYYSLSDNGDKEAAYRLLNENKQILQPYLFTNESANKIEKEIDNIRKDIFLNQKIVFSETKPLEPLATNSEWLQPY